MNKGKFDYKKTMNYRNKKRLVRTKKLVASTVLATALTFSASSLGITGTILTNPGIVVQAASLADVRLLEDVEVTRSSTISTETVPTGSLCR